MTESDHTTVVTGWDWEFGAVTLMHGLLTLPLCMSIVGGVSGSLLWLSVSLMIAAGVGWRVTVMSEGFAFSRTWFGVPLRTRHFGRETPVGIEDDPHAPEGADFARYVVLGRDSNIAFGSSYNAQPIHDALVRGIQRHHA